MTNYNYVILGSDWDLYQLAYSDLFNYPNVKYVSGRYPNLFSLKGLLYRLHFLPLLNRIVRIPGKQVWNGAYFKNDFKENLPICFIFLADWVSSNNETHYIEYLKKQYPHCKMVWYAQDLFSTKCELYTNKPVEVDKYRKYFDIIISYDKRESERYGILYHHSIFSEIQPQKYGIIDETIDCLFIGRDKGRLPDLVEVYDKLTSSGLVCKFFVLNVSKNEQIHRSGISYISKPLSYLQNLKMVWRSKCLVEILQPNATGFTYRALESIMYDKVLLTNNCDSYNPFIGEDFVVPFKSVIDIDAELIHTKIRNRAINPLKDKIKPEHLLKFIESNLSNKK